MHTDNFGSDLLISENHQRFLLDLSDHFREYPDEAAIGMYCVRALAEYFGADRCYIGQMSEAEDQALVGPEYYHPGLRPIAGVHSYKQYPAVVRRLKEGENLLVNNVMEDSDLSDLDKVSLREGQGLNAFMIASLYRGAGNSIWTLVVGSVGESRWSRVDLRLVEEVAERTWSAIRQARTSQALSSSEEKYRSLFNSIDEGFCIIQMVFDENERPVDYQVLEANLAFIEQTGLKDAIGKSLRKLAPTHEDFWYETYGRIALTGIPERFENKAEAFNRWYDVYAFRIGEPSEQKVAVLFKDINERILAQEALRKAVLAEAQERQRKQTLVAVLNAQEEERKRISESLHNGLGQLLFAIKMNMANLTEKQMKFDPDSFHKDLKYTSDLLTTAIDQTRNLSHELIPMTLQDHGLKSVLEDVCKTLPNGPRIQVRIEGLTERFDSYLELAIYRIAQELILNVVKHARAEKASLELKVSLNKIQMTVSDDGLGFTPGLVTKGIGLSSIRNKVSLLDGQMLVNAAPGKGTRISVSIPVNSYSVD